MTSPDNRPETGAETARKALGADPLMTALFVTIGRERRSRAIRILELVLAALRKAEEVPPRG